MPAHTQAPPRIAFVHLMRTGGTTLAHFFSRELAETHLIYNSWERQLKRDWTEAELLEFAQQPEPMFVHNHIVNWSRKLIRVYQKSGFRLFSLVRPVGDQLCSLYYWLEQREPDQMRCSLDEFLVEQLTNDDRPGINKQHWEIPEWWRDLNFVRPLTEKGLSALLIEDLHIAPEVAAKLSAKCENRSPNPGYEQALADELISAETGRLLKNSIAWQRYEQVVAQLVCH